MQYKYYFSCISTDVFASIIFSTFMMYVKFYTAVSVLEFARVTSLMFFSFLLDLIVLSPLLRCTVFYLPVSMSITTYTYLVPVAF